jgi:hypothetical protein
MKRYLGSLAAAGLIGLLAVLVAVAPVAAIAGWSGPTRVSSGVFEEPSLAVDGSGRIHVAMTGPAGSIYYLTNRTGPWTRQRLTSGNDWAPSIALDDAGHVFVAFHRLADCKCTPQPSEGIRIVSNLTGVWTTRVVTTDAGDQNPSLRVRDGRQHVAWMRSGSGIWYRTNAAGPWSAAVRLIADAYVSQITGTHPSLRVDDAGRLHLVYDAIDEVNPPATNRTGVYYLRGFAGGAISRQRITSRAAWTPVIALDASGRPHVAYSASGVGTYYATRDSAGVWHSSRVTLHDGGVSIALTPAGRVHLVYGESDFRGLVHASNVSGAWAFTRLSSVGNSGQVRLDAALKARVVYTRTDASSTYNGVYYARQL